MREEAGLGAARPEVGPGGAGVTAAEQRTSGEFAAALERATAAETRSALIRAGGSTLLTPGQWLPSASHGIEVVTREHLLAGGMKRAELNRHAMSRVVSISFDEVAHALTVDVIRLVQTRDGEMEKPQRELVKLVPEVSPERAFGFAKHVLGLSQR